VNPQRITHFSRAGDVQTSLPFPDLQVIWSNQAAQSEKLCPFFITANVLDITTDDSL
jgi:hypothetical protein